MIYFTSDLHLGHANIIKYCKRPFTSVEEMNDTLISNINDTVATNHQLYILGDYSFLPAEETIELSKRIKCKNVYLIRGNHDKLQDGIYFKAGLKSTAYNMFTYYHELKFNKIKYILCHFPFLTWNQSGRKSINVHGHCHGDETILELNSQTRRIDVGVDCFNYKPISIVEIEKIMKERVYKPVDHHGKVDL